MRTSPVAGPHERRTRPCRAVRAMVVSLRGVRRAPASVPRSTGIHGGREVVGFVSANDDPVARAQSRCDDSMHALPWHGPHRDGGVPLEELHGVEPLRRPPSSAPCSSRPCRGIRTACRRAPTPPAAGPRDRPAASASRASAPIRSTSTSRPTAAAASRPANRPCVTAASTERAPATAPAAWTFDGSSTGRYACAASSNASSAPVIASRFVDGMANPDDTTRSQAILLPVRAPGWPDGHARDPSPAVRRQDASARGRTSDAVGPGRLVGAQDRRRSRPRRHP